MATLAESLEQSITKLRQPVPPRGTPSISIVIPRIPTSIRSQNCDLYEPQMVAIGPYQDHEEKKFEDIVSHKLHYLNDLEERNKKVNYQTYIGTMTALNEMRPPSRCYSDEIIKNIADFLKVLLLDGCFILELVLKLENKQKHHLCSAGWDFMTILSDLLLIENQIPFFVLTELYATFKGVVGIEKDQLESEFKCLVVRNLFPYLGHTSILFSQENKQWNPTVDHLLQLYHEFTLLNTKARNCKDVADDGKKRKNPKLPVIMPSATQLLEFGIKLSKQNTPQNCDADLYNSTLKIPELIIDPARKAILMNLLEFEQSLDDKTKSRWTGLMVLMHCMVKNKDDLEIMRRDCIVINLLPSEDNAIDFFGQLCKYIAVDFGDHYYSELVEKINTKCDHYFRKKRATFMHEYFKNRWALMSFVCSICAISLSIVQTLVSVSTYRHKFL